MSEKHLLSNNAKNQKSLDLNFKELLENWKLVFADLPNDISHGINSLLYKLQAIVQYEHWNSLALKKLHERVREVNSKILEIQEIISLNNVKNAKYYSQEVVSLSEKINDLELFLKHVILSFPQSGNSTEQSDNNLDTILNNQIKTSSDLIDRLMTIQNFYENTFNKLTEDINTRANGALSKIENRANDSIKTLKGFLEEDFSKQKNELDKKFNDLSNDLKQSNDLLKKTTYEATESINKSFENQAMENLEKLNSYTDQGQNLHHYLSGKALSGFFNDRATVEGNSAHNWTIATWVFAGLTLASLIFVLIYQLYNPSDRQDVNIQFLTTKVLITATLGLIAKWCSKRANRHLCEEAKYHRLQINTATVEPFISKLKEDSRDEILKAVALKTFTETGADSNTSIEFETPSILDAVKSALIPKSDK